MWFRVLTVLEKKGEFGFQLGFPFTSRCDREFDSLDEVVEDLAAFYGITEFVPGEDGEPGLKGFMWVVLSGRRNNEEFEVRALVKICE